MSKKIRIQQALRLLEPLVVNINGTSKCSCDFSQFSLNAPKGGASKYPLKIEDGLILTEALGASNPRSNFYKNWIFNSLEPLRHLLDLHPGGVLFEDLPEIGSKIQEIDADWVRDNVFFNELDPLHHCYGPDDSHPYRKITLCRSTFPLFVAGKKRRAFIEKFLVVYSYWSYKNSIEGQRTLTVTPLHSHPMNFEVTYFANYDNSSCVEEEEFIICLDDGKNCRPVIQSGDLDKAAISKAGIRRDKLRAIPHQREIWIPAQSDEMPIRILQDFDNDKLLAQPEIIGYTDSLFRPHKVTVSGDVDKTHYFAINNYISLTGEVYLYKDDGRLDECWNHDTWAQGKDN
tara:strand:- start:11117 stop:12151 length:1035 start_codon:yes stop_codon:yes gene_type:complete